MTHPTDPAPAPISGGDPDATVRISRPADAAADAQAAPSDGEYAARRAAMALPAGSLLHGRFEVQDLIGSPGGFGIAYLCRDRQLERSVVVKELFPAGMVRRADGGTAVLVLRPELQASFDLQLALLLDEARRLAALAQVDAVVTVHDHFSENNTGYIVMHQVFGRPLSERLRELGRVDAPQLMRWIWPLLEGLEAVHDAGVLHRDIKPANVLIDHQDRPVLIDFGNAAARGGDGRDLGSYRAVSPGYSAPEQFANHLERMGPWTDLYALGALMYAALTGQRPPDATHRTAGDVLDALRRHAPQAPAALLDVVDACLAEDEQLRPVDVRSVRRRLAAFQPADRHWLDLLGDDAFGRRMRGVYALMRQGHSVPREWRQWNLSAGLLQSFWFFGHRLPVAGTASAALTLLVAAAWMWSRDPWPGLPAALGLAWALGFVPCALFADLLQYGRVDQLAKRLPAGNDQQLADARRQLARSARADWRTTGFGILLPLLVVAVATMLNDRQAGVQRRVESALELAAQREAFAGFVREHGRPPVAGDVPPYTPNSEVRSVELRPTGLEVVLNLPEVDGRRARWTLDALGAWHCEAVDLPPRHTPAGCAKAP